MDLPPEHNALVEAVLEAQPRTVVVLVNGSAVAMPWAARVPAVLEGWLGGQGGGGAIAEALLGQVNPSGKLGESFPVRLEDTPAHLSFPHDGTDRVPFGEGLFTGYRWYDARRIAPLFPFGHGLSYTNFEYCDLVLNSSGAAQGAPLEVSVSLVVRNIGTRYGREVVQLYVRERQPRLTRPEKELKSFAKVALGPGERAEVTFELGERDFAYFDPRVAGWVVNSGEFDLLVGSSSADIRLEQSVTLEGTPLQAPLGRLSPLRDWMKNEVARDRIQPAMNVLLRELFGSGHGPELAQSFVADMPVSKLVMIGALSEQDLAHLIEVANKAT
jgi:beta-glucosidase